ncbi:unnamed protein product [Ranitomeya imitator]|uniref:Uncharacterized protein n=1 Tax=Ranitomeya imitator TaxID=111125 RepID=A0ABN9LAQ3_9NEOB|nr:unnamed protein product [Ranitomeya imitator]
MCPDSTRMRRPSKLLISTYRPYPMGQRPTASSTWQCHQVCTTT